MEHEVFVPVAVEPLRRLLADPERVAGVVPGLQQDAGGPPVSGRLKVRVGGTSITYRGALRISERDDGGYLVEGEATEVRGGGAVSVALTLRLLAADGGTTLVFGGGAHGGGRFADLDAKVAETAGRRLLNKAGARLADAAPGTADAAPDTAGTAPGADELPAGGTDEARAEPAAPLEPARGEEGEGPRPDALDAAAAGDGGAVFEVDNQPPAEAAHARRTMIGRSAEEVDHAPPRGRYAPVPAPESSPASVALRWAGPAAAVVLASAIVIGRALRRRR
ncbi:hypothetical protein GCM10018793_02010 [Streptomyces sulfonofaciens]|uniref:Carbon monoxide dehydrogenase subunit G n=1 Tax=Streptomyces sulfonofaciens TaxID=68272 RepID=A0A919KRK7_9ACTN|nr:SRPBCC domain-containing protein [Streptomyces sulfonofaciens]GHH69491.1 hypothetical protein GCM10018793_02010 [Streptomyces sulfonofaciens]